MTVSTTINRVPYSGNGVTTLFPFPYYFLADADLVVLLVNATTLAETLQVITTNYTVMGAADPAGGSVTMLVAPPSGYTLVIYRDPAITQSVDLVENDPLPVETAVERPLDRLTMIAQRLADRVSRAFHLSEGASSAISLSLIPAPSQFIAWAADGLSIISAVPTTLTVPVTSFVLTLLDDATAAAFMTTLGISSFMQTVLDDTSAAAALTTLGAEAVANKSTDATLASNSDTLYPSQKAIKTYVDAGVTGASVFRHRNFN